MIVCICHDVSDLEIRQAVDLGLSTMEELRRDLGIGSTCGSCVDCAKRVLTAHLEKKVRTNESGSAPG